MNASLVNVALAGYTTWQYTDAELGGGWVSERSYQVKVWAVDDLGNAENPAVKYTILYDTVPPDVGITNPMSGARLNTLPVVSGTANAGLSGLSDVRLTVSSWTAGAGWTVVTANAADFAAIQQVEPFAFEPP